MKIRGIRGAITVDKNEIDEINQSTYELMSKIIERNALEEDDVVSIIFTATKDINKHYPSVAVRELLGWKETPILNFEEKDIENSLRMCVRVMLHVYTDKGKDEVVHVYLKNAQQLRLDLCLK